MAKSKMIKVDTTDNQAEFKIALYERVSTDAQVEGYSIDVQKERLEAYALSMTPDKNSFSHYTDDGFSGGNIDRPALQKLLMDIEYGNITHVIVYKLDRLSRSQKDTLYLIEDVFIPKNISFISVQETLNTATPFGRAMIGILSVFAQLERENIYERTRGGMQKRVESGLWPGGNTTPFGYNYDSMRGTLVKNPDADIVKQIFELYINGESEDSLAKKFGLRYDRIVHQILTRKSYTGVIPYKGEFYKGIHDPIIDEKTYNTVQKCMRDRSARKLVSKTDHLLTGLFECGICGAKMRYSPWGKQGHKITCYSQQSSKAYLIKDPNCNNSKLNAAEIEQIVLDDLFTMTEGFNPSATNPKNDKSVLDVLTNQLRVAENKIKRLYTLYGESGDDYILDSIQECKNEIQNIKNRITEEETKNSIDEEAIAIYERIKNLKGIWNTLSQQEKISIIRSLIEKIIISHESINIIYKL